MKALVLALTVIIRFAVSFTQGAFGFSTKVSAHKLDLWVPWRWGKERVKAEVATGALCSTLATWRYRFALFSMITLEFPFAVGITITTSLTFLARALLGTLLAALDANEPQDRFRLGLLVM